MTTNITTNLTYSSFTPWDTLNHVKFGRYVEPNVKMSCRSSGGLFYVPVP